MGRLLLIAVIVYVAYRALLMVLNWQAQQAALDREAALAVAADQEQAAKYGMYGSIAGGVSSLFGGLLRGRR